jgi:hypothetical protein
MPLLRKEDWTRLISVPTPTKYSICLKLLGIYGEQMKKAEKDN